MYKIISKEQLNQVIHRVVIDAPRVAKNAKAGQFIMIMPTEKGERIPLTIYSSDASKGTVTIIFQEAGKTTKELASFKSGGTIANIVGPLGRPTMVDKAGRMVIVGGGVGIAELVPIARHAKEMGNEVTVIIGARSKDLLILEDEIREIADRLLITTDDGSHGEKGLVTAPLKRLLDSEKFAMAYAVGPDIMMQSVCLTTKEFDLKTIVSLDANMIDATGMCGTCRVVVGTETKFACVDGPEFDGHKVDFVEFAQRQKRFNKEEKLSQDAFKKRCKCRER